MPSGRGETEEKSFGLMKVKIGRGEVLWDLSGVLEERVRRFRRSRVNGDCAILFVHKERELGKS